MNFKNTTRTREMIIPRAILTLFDCCLSHPKTTFTAETPLLFPMIWFSIITNLSLSLYLLWCCVFQSFCATFLKSKGYVLLSERRHDEGMRPMMWRLYFLISWTNRIMTRVIMVFFGYKILNAYFWYQI